MPEKRSWFYNNIGTLVTGLVLVLSIAVAWGRLETKIGQVEASIRLAHSRINSLDERVRQHVENSDRHVDKEFKDEMRVQLGEIRALLVAHLARNQ